MNITDMEGIGPARAEALRAMGIISLRDLLFTLPVRYEDHETVSPCRTSTPGNILVQGRFTDPLKMARFNGITRVTGTICDASGKMPVCWYNEPWMATTIKVWEEVRLYGRLNIKNGRRTLQNPRLAPEGGWIPVYRPVRGFPAKSFRKLITEALNHLEDCCPETLPREFRMEHRLCELNFALREAHFPQSMMNLEIARRRLSFERILIYLMYVTGIGTERHKAHAFPITEAQTEAYWQSLVFAPTGAQRKVLEEIAADLRKETAMARLIQGDVGSGKTAVAFGAIRLAKEAGFQAAMMAPTEILAAQHYESARETLETAGIRCRLLTGSTKAKERREILKELAEGGCDAVFGTHALISKDVAYQRLGLVITDEQHRFGVNQRSALGQKGEDAEQTFPHVLVLSATPIPRTLALILYGDLDISIIDEMPKGRTPVKTFLVPEAKREGMYGFLREQVRAGRQAYIVCPAVEDSETMDELKSAKAVYEELSTGPLKDLRIGLTWGNQKAAEKEQTLQDFHSGKFDVLVATTVIEVGINNPNATIMIIENAERFGLSQLHQLRGRVGRGSAESWCFLLSENSGKIDILCKTNDGFVISQKDLEMRGPGDLMGTRQSGDFTGMLTADMNGRLLEEVSRAVQELRRDPAQKKTLQQLEDYAKEYFAAQEHEIAIN